AAVFLSSSGLRLLRGLGDGRLSGRAVLARGVLASSLNGLDAGAARTARPARSLFLGRLLAIPGRRGSGRSGFGRLRLLLPRRARPGRRFVFLRQHDLGRDALDHRLRAGAVVALLAALVSTPFRAVVPARLLRLRLLGLRRREALVAVVVAVLVVALVAHLLLLRHLRQRGHDDAAVVLGVLGIVLRPPPVAGALRVARQRRVLLRDLLRRAADLHVRAVALVVAGKWIGALAVLVLVVVVAAASAHAPVLLWPHSSILMLEMHSVAEAAKGRALCVLRLAGGCKPYAPATSDPVPVHVVSERSPHEAQALSTLGGSHSLKEPNR